MKTTLKISQRVFILFFRDRATIFYTLLGSIIMLVVYLLFLNGAFFSDEDLLAMPTLINIQNNWLMAGLVCITSFSAAFTALSQLPTDRREKIFDDFVVAPIQRSQIVSGYIIGATLTAFTMSLFTVLFSYLFLLIENGTIPDFTDSLLIVALTFLNTFVSSALAFFFASGKSSPRSYGSLSSVLLTLIGFFAGVYIPYGGLGKGVQMITSLLPISHTTGLMRQVFTRESLLEVAVSAKAGFLQEFRLYFGIDTQLVGFDLKPWMSISYVLFLSVLFFYMGIQRMTKNRE